MSILARPRPLRADDPADAEALEALIEEARRRARRRRRGYAASALVAAAAGLLGFYGFNHGGATHPRTLAEQAPVGAGVPPLGGASWRPARGLERAFIIALAVDPRHPRNVFAASREAGVFKSSDGGRSWRPVFTPSTDSAGRFDALAIVPQDPKIVYAGTGGGVFKSSDGGGTWHAANSGLFGKESAEERQHRLDEGYVTALVVDPRDSETVFAVTYRDVFKTTNGGASWRRVGLGRAFASALAIGPKDGETIYVGAAGAFAGSAKSGIFKSTDGGGSWRAVGLQGRNVGALALDPEHAETLYAGTDDPAGLFKSTDGGASWRALGLEGDSIALDPQDPDTLYAGAGDEVFRSTDGGRTWRALEMAGVPAGGFTALALDARKSTTLFAGAAAGVFKSRDAGRNWRATNAGLSAYRAGAFAVSTASPGTAYAAIEGGGVAKRAGGRWRTVNTDHNVTALAVDPQDPDVVYAGADDPARLLKSTDGGRSWRRLRAPWPPWVPDRNLAAVAALAVDPQNPKIVYANATDFFVSLVWFKSTDGGAAWHVAEANFFPYAADADSEPSALTFDPLDPDTLYAYGEGAALFKSTNGGATWQRAGSPVIPTSVSVHLLAIEPRQPATLYAGGDEGVFKSTDAGSSWRAVNAGFEDRSVSALAIDPQHPQTVYAGTDSGLFRSTNGGRSWQSFSDGLPTKGSIDELAVDPAAGILYAAVYGRGIFELTLGP